MKLLLACKLPRSRFRDLPIALNKTVWGTVDDPLVVSS